MSKKGYIENNYNPDLVLNAISVFKNKKYWTAASTGYGGVYRPYGYWGGTGSTSFKTYNYKEGSLVIDVVDARANNLLF